MTMTLTEQLQADRDKRDAERAAALPDFIRHATLLDARVTVHADTAEQLAAILTAAGGHNRYDEDAAIAALGPLVADSMGVSVEHWRGGPAVYVLVPFWNHQRMAHRGGGVSTGDKLTTDERKAYVQKVIDTARALNADEISTRQYGGGDTDGDVVWNHTGEQPTEVRIWWD